MNYFLILWLLVPLLAFVFSLLVSSKREKLLSQIAFFSAAFQLITSLIYTVQWLLMACPTLNIKELTLYRSEGYEYYLDLQFDAVSAVYLIMGSVLTFLITLYSRYYLHRESGYKRFFNTILFFYFGYNLTVLSGNLETLFIGWEVLGISSFLLIGFYRERYLPVRNAFKIFSIYRLGDLGIILGMWLCHHAWHENITFVEINSTQVNDHLSYSVTAVISLLFIFSAMIKSAQFPFTYWLPRAMEGPTPSSAIFYGSLAVHIGLFLLLRTHSFWDNHVSIRILVGFIGLITAITAAISAQVQSNIKAQVAYSSASQIGIMFIELSLGLDYLVLLHFVGNAFLRTHQLLISPSAVTYLIREQFYHFSTTENVKESIRNSFSTKLKNSLYVLGLKEWNLDFILYRYVWSNLKRVGKNFTLFNLKNSAWVFIPIFFLGVFFYFQTGHLNPVVIAVLPYLYAGIGLLLILRSFVERKSAYWAWFLVLLNHAWTALAVSFNEHFTLGHIWMYIGGISVSFVTGMLVLRHINQRETKLLLDQYNGLSIKYPKTTLVFLMSCLGMAGFPITPSFIGEDLIFSHIHPEQWGLVLITSLSFILDGIALIRIFTRIFLGPNSENPAGVAYKSS